LFVASQHTSPDRAWAKLFDPVLHTLRETSPASDPSPAIVSLALRDWFEDLLKRQGFVHHQDIVVFLYDREPPPPVEIEGGIRLREMKDDDLPAVQQIDRLAFEPIWRLSLDDLRFASGRSSYCTVAERDGQVIAYTMSSSTPTYAHLARLAVHPQFQGRRLGFALVQDLLDQFLNHRNAWGVTLNTQHDNHSSLALYHRVGFRETGERFPVYIYPD
jgi:ribosomal-protein-alanine N-acetyltransferase